MKREVVGQGMERAPPSADSPVEGRATQTRSGERNIPSLHPVLHRISSFNLTMISG